jgi:serine/threonine protein kinase
MFDNKFEPVIIDFGFATEIRDQNKNIKKLDKFWGTKEYKCPEIWEEKEYSGETADIFSLGVVLFNLVTGRIGFQTSKTDDEIYNLIIEGEKNRTYENYWDIIKGAVKKLSENFKNLYIKMVSYNPKNRPTAQQILENPWFDEINNLSDENKKKN